VSAHTPPVRHPQAPGEVSVTTIRARDAVLLPAAPEAVWDVLVDFPAYDAWWPWMVRVEPLTIAPAVVGSNVAVRPLAGPDFQWRVHEAVAAERLRLRYHSGPYAGMGEWRLVPDAPSGGTLVSYEVDLTTSHPLLQPLSRLVNLGALHSLLMESVLEGLGREVARRSGVAA
jgi:uncharacterized protein YndB with AHSA1/START domain